MSNKVIGPVLVASLLAVFYFAVIVILVFIDIVSWLKIALIIMDTFLVGLMIQMTVEKILQIMEEEEKTIRK